MPTTDVGQSERWMVVRRSRSILGGYEVVRAGLDEEGARRFASWYVRPHEAMREADLYALRTAAIQASQRGRTET